MSTLLKDWRASAKMSAEDAARQANVSLPTWSRWETGARRVPAERVVEIARVTGISRHELRPDLYPQEGV